LPIFQYTGKKDCDSQEIYCGNLLQKQISPKINIIAKIVWSKISCCYFLKPQKVHDDIYNQRNYEIFCLQGWKYIFQMRINAD